MSESLDRKYSEDAIKHVRKGCLWDAPNEMVHGAIIDTEDSWKYVSAAKFLIRFPT
jgi:hypothetical protein